MQVWEHEPHSVLVLISLPVQTDLSKAMSQADLKDGQLQKREQIKICSGSQDALFATGEGESKVGPTDSNSKPSEVEFLATNVKGKTYLAMYARPLKSRADPAAQAAIRHICPK